MHVFEVHFRNKRNLHKRSTWKATQLDRAALAITLPKALADKAKHRRAWAFKMHFHLFSRTRSHMYLGCKIMHNLHTSTVKWLLPCILESRNLLRSRATLLLKVTSVCQEQMTMNTFNSLFNQLLLETQDAIRTPQCVINAYPTWASDAKKKNKTACIFYCYTIVWLLYNFATTKEDMIPVQSMYHRLAERTRGYWRGAEARPLGESIMAVLFSAQVTKMKS